MKSAILWRIPIFYAKSIHFKTIYNYFKEIFTQQKQFTQTNDSDCEPSVQPPGECDRNVIKQLYKSPWPYSSEIHLDVKITHTLRTKTSKEFKMNANPRGRAIIFVTIPVLVNEAKRFRSIFTQLLFDTEVISVPNKLNCDEIKAKLSEVANANSYHGDAFIMMFIGDGYNEQIIGWRPETNDDLPPPESDCMAFSEIVATFGWTRAPALRQKTKVFIFNCDRLKISTENYVSIAHKRGYCPKRDGHLLGRNELPLIDKLTMLDPQFIGNDSENTQVIYACREGYPMWYNTNKINGPIGHVSQFGQTLSHTIAQYSSDKSLIEMFVMTLNRMEEELMESNYKQRPEIDMFEVTKELYFSPGLSKINV